MLISPQWLDLLSGYRVVELDSCMYDVLLPTMTILHESLYYVRKVSQEAVGKMYTKEDIESHREELLPEEEIEILDTFEEKIAAYTRDLEIQTNAGKRKITRLRIEELTERKKDIDIKWIKLLSMTDEGLGSIIQTHYCFYKCVRYHENREPLWDSFDSYLDETDTIFIRRLMTLFLEFSNEFTDTELRKIAKVGFYRAISQIGKENLISPYQSMLDMSMEGIKLLYWITYYSNALQGSNEDCPSEIIEDDKAFDAWADRQRKNISVDEGTTKSSNSKIGKVAGKSRERVIIG